MLLRHSGLYLLGRGGPAILNLSGIALYTRLLDPHQYGRYALVFALVLFINTLCFHWLRTGILRFLSAYQGKKEALLSAVALAFLVLTAITGLIGAIQTLIWSDPTIQILSGLGILLLWAHAWFDVNLELMRSQLAPVRYGLMYLARSVIFLGVGGLLAYLGFGAAGLLWGLITALLIPGLVALKQEWRGIRYHLVDWHLLAQFLRYGLPLTASFVLSYVIGNSDRVLLGWLLGADATGLYAVGYDFARQSLFVLMMVVNLAALPLAIRALEQQGGQAASEQLAKNLVLLLAVALPAATGLALLAANIADVVLGRSYRDTATVLMPWVALGTLLAGLNSFYFSQSFHLAKSTGYLMWIFLVVALVNIGLNLWWIQKMGIMGAAYAMVVAHGLAVSLSWFWGRRVFPLPIPLGEAAKIILATLGMAIAVYGIAHRAGAVALIGQIILGVSVYGVLILLLNVQRCRARLIEWWRTAMNIS